MPNWIQASDPAAVAVAAERLRGGDLVVLPTDTVYGVAAGLDTDLNRIFVAKGRPDDRTLPVLLASPEGLTLVAVGVAEPILGLASRFWPGPLTVVMPAREGLPREVLGEGNTVGVRVPDHELARSVIAASGGALAVTSANRSGEPPATDAQAAADVLGDEIDLILDGGRVAGGVPSTVVRVRDNRLEILREGALSAESIREVWHDLTG